MCDPFQNLMGCVGFTISVLVFRERALHFLGALIPVSESSSGQGGERDSDMFGFGWEAGDIGLVLPFALFL